MLRAIGGHPRMLEYLHGLLNQGQARLPHVTALLRKNATAAGVNLRRSRSLLEAIDDARRIGAADILLDQLLAAFHPDDLAVLRQIAVFPRAVTAEVLVRCGLPEPALRDLSVAYNQMGDLMRALGQGDAARNFFQKSLAIAEQLVR